MKTKIALGVILLVALLLAVSVPASAQMQVNPNNMQFYYYYSSAAAKSYTNSQTDTIPQPTSAETAVTVKVGGASYITYQITTLDSAAADVYVDYREIGTTTWVNAVTDSIITATNTGKVSKEYIIRSQKSDNILEGMTMELRARIAFRSAANGTTTATYTSKWIWKP